MADIFTKGNLQSLLRNRHVWLLGDSNMRALYKDMVWLMQKNSIVSEKALRTKLEHSYMNDHLIKGDSLHRGRTYEEERLYTHEKQGTTLEFMFLTKCLTEPFRQRLLSLKGTLTPDILIINSCLWDICRWGPDGVTNYKNNIVELMGLMKQCLSPNTLVIWTTTPPLAASIHGSLVIKQIQFMKHSARFEVMEGNLFVRQEVISHGFDILDLHYYLLLQIDKRCRDGIHWQPATVRYMTNLVLTHISLSLGNPLPGNFKSPVIDRLITICEERTITTANPNKELERLSHIASAQQVPTTNMKTPKRRKKRAQATYANYQGRWKGGERRGRNDGSGEPHRSHANYRPY